MPRNRSRTITLPVADKDGLFYVGEHGVIHNKRSFADKPVEAPEVVFTFAPDEHLDWYVVLPSELAAMACEWSNVPPDVDGDFAGVIADRLEEEWSDILAHPFYAGRFGPGRRRSMEYVRAMFRSTFALGCYNHHVLTSPLRPTARNRRKRTRPTEAVNA